MNRRPLPPISQWEGMNGDIGEPEGPDQSN